MNFNYTSICAYCGEIYKCNRSTSKYCCTEHNSLFHAYGSIISDVDLSSNGIYVDYLWLLLLIYFEDPNPVEWSKTYNNKTLERQFHYDGPLPEGDELILVGQFLIRKLNLGFGGDGHYSFKPFHLLTKKEKASNVILNRSSKSGG